MQATPATRRLLLESTWEGSMSLKILCGGEAVSRSWPISCWTKERAAGICMVQQRQLSGLPSIVLGKGKDPSHWAIRSRTRSYTCLIVICNWRRSVSPENSTLVAQDWRAVTSTSPN